jgi:hypothetical protein
MKVLSFATLCLASLISYSVKANYPFIVYTGASQNKKPTENRTPVSFDSVVSEYHSFVEGKTNVLVFVKEGLTTKSLHDAAKSCNFL